MRKRLRNIVLSMLILLPVLLLPASADIGPKPSVIVDFIGIPDGEQYFVTLLAEESESGPWGIGVYADGDPLIRHKFATYEDPDGFRFLGCYDECTVTNQFIWAYYPPERFKIMLYVPNTNSIAITDQIYEQYAFDSYFNAEFHPDGTLTANRTVAAGVQIFAFLMRLALTISVELLIARLLGFRRRQLLFILAVNVFTQMLLNITLMREYIPSFFWYITMYGILELAIALLEGTVYQFFLPKLGELQEKTLPMFYGLVANPTSFLLGYALSKPFPSLF